MRDRKDCHSMELSINKPLGIREPMNKKSTGRLTSVKGDARSERFVREIATRDRTYSRLSTRRSS